MRLWLLLCLLHWWLSPGLAKRTDPSMVDPLPRRSALDKNFMRFGRSSPPYPRETEDDARGAEVSKEDNFLRSMRGKDDLLRDMRAKSDSFMRFGRGNQANYMRFGRGKQDSFMRFGRGKQNNFMRFGRGKQDSFMRFGRGKQDNFMRFGRGKQDNFMRFGRGKQDSFMRFGKGKQNNFMKFGRYPEDDTDFFVDSLYPDFQRTTRGKQDSFMRFGKRLAGDSDEDLPIAMRSTSNLIRYGRGKQDNFMRFGKSDNSPSLEISDFDLLARNNDFSRDKTSKESNLLRFGRKPPSKDDSFMRFGRSSNGEEESSSLIPRRKRSVLESYATRDDIYPAGEQDETDNNDLISFPALPQDLDEEYSSQINQEEYSNRRKRSLTHDTSTPPPFTDQDKSVDYIATKLRLDSSTVPQLQSSLFSAGIPNVIVGPEFSLLPDINPSSSMMKRKPGDKSFLRLG